MTREDYKLLPLATVGFASGLFKYYVKPELTAKRSWVAIGAMVAAHELLCPSGELLSEGADKLIEKHPIATRLAIGVTAAHLCNLLPEKIDPFHHFTKALR